MGAAPASVGSEVGFLTSFFVSALITPTLVGQRWTRSNGLFEEAESGRTQSWSQRVGGSGGSGASAGLGSTVFGVPPVVAVIDVDMRT